MSSAYSRSLAKSLAPRRPHDPRRHHELRLTHVCQTLVNLAAGHVSRVDHVGSVSHAKAAAPEFVKTPSLRAQRVNRAQARGAPGRNQARGEHDRREHDGNRHERHEVQWRDFEEDTCEKPAHGDRDGHSDR